MCCLHPAFDVNLDEGRGYEKLSPLFAAATRVPGAGTGVQPLLCSSSSPAHLSVRPTDPIILPSNTSDVFIIICIFYYFHCCFVQDTGLSRFGLGFLLSISNSHTIFLDQNPSDNDYGLFYSINFPSGKSTRSTSWIPFSNRCLRRSHWAKFWTWQTSLL